MFQIQVEVGCWSMANFGVQISKPRPDMKLDSIAPLLGIVEEVGEYEDAACKGDEAEMLDAIGDILIYLCDFIGREPGCSMFFVDQNNKLYKNITLTSAAGHLCHWVLKYHQGIRGMDIQEKYYAQRDNAIHNMMIAIDDICTNVLNTTMLDVLNETWESVQKRNWKKNPVTGRYTRIWRRI